MMATSLREERATYALALPAKAMPTGSSNQETPSPSTSWMVSTTRRKVSLPGTTSITLTLSETWFETQTSVPSGFTATLTGSRPTSIWAICVWLAVWITLTELLVVLATYRRLPSAERATGFDWGLVKVWWPSAGWLSTPPRRRPASAMSALTNASASTSVSQRMDWDMGRTSVGSTVEGLCMEEGGTRILPAAPGRIQAPKRLGGPGQSGQTPTGAEELPDASRLARELPGRVR
jgi:hypothetical protein